MKIRVEIDGELDEDEVLIRCRRMDETVRKLYGTLTAQIDQGPKITFYKQNQEYYFPLSAVLFFETAGEHVYAHTADDEYMIKHRLYELEQRLPRDFIRAAKSTIVNVRQIYSLTRNLASASRIQFAGSQKQVYASRLYFNELRRRIQERGQYES